MYKLILFVLLLLVVTVFSCIAKKGEASASTTNQVFVGSPILVLNQ